MKDRMRTSLKQTQYPKRMNDGDGLEKMKSLRNKRCKIEENTSNHHMEKSISCLTAKQKKNCAINNLKRILIKKINSLENLIDKI